MRILMTGYTTLQIQHPKARKGIIQKLDVPAAVFDALRELGHEVDWRQVRLGEDLASGYDLVWLNVSSPASVNSSRGAMGALWTVNCGLPTVGFLDDWQYRQNVNAHKLIVTQPDKRLFAMMGDKPLHGGETQDTIRQHRDVIIQACSDMLGERWRRGMLCAAPLFTWGDPAIVPQKITAGNYLPPAWGLDPSFITKPHLEKAWAELFREGWPQRQRKWQLGAISKQTSWVDKLSQDSTWGAEQFGHNKTNNRLKTETDVVKRYASAWGVLSPPYPQNGSGWFRSRFIYAAFVGSVLYTEKHEADQLGTAYRYPMTWIEQMDDAQLAQLSRNQREALWPALTGRAEFVARVQQMITSAQLNDHGGEDSRQITMQCQNRLGKDAEVIGLASPATSRGDVLAMYESELER